ncbi:hypothetical protein MPLSOD_340154 [Mesorhizobium sp. SOD10]|nr:hypothetical protein MPLSOD_340154 [Mesorhizobium sp. SOD10]
MFSNLSLSLPLVPSCLNVKRRRRLLVVDNGEAEMARQKRIVQHAMNALQERRPNEATWNPRLRHKAVPVDGYLYRRAITQ